MGMKEGDMVRVKKLIHKISGGKPGSYEMVKEGRIVRFKGKLSAIVSINLRQYANGEWHSEEMICRVQDLTKLEQVSA